MKKILFSLCALAMCLGFSSCKETWDDAPKLEGHEGVVYDDFLNQPAMQQQFLMLSQNNRDGYFHLTCSQPYYGYAAIVSYKVQISLTEDFAEYEELNQIFYNCADINPVNHDVASAIEKLAGVVTEADLPLDYRRVYMRLRAYIEQSPDDTEYISNAVYFDNVGADYLAIWVADQMVNIYLRGSFDEGWNALPEYQFMTGESENTWVIKEFTLTAGTEFKVADSSWGPLNLGSGSDNVVTPGEPYALSGGDNPGNLVINVDFHGLIQLSLESGTYYLTLEPAE